MHGAHTASFSLHWNVEPLSLAENSKRASVRVVV
jgi:hypothetical protein